MLIACNMGMEISNSYISKVPSLPSEETFFSKESFWGENGFSFKSIVDMLNPLQHIPIISSIYRDITGDVPAGGGSRLVGGALFGGVVGFVNAFFNNFFEERTGSDIGGHIVQAFKGESDNNINAAAIEKYEKVSPQEKTLGRIYTVDI